MRNVSLLKVPTQPIDNIPQAIMTQIKKKKLLSTTSIINHLCEPGNYTDNELEQSIQRLKFNQILSKSGFRKQKGDPLIQVFFTLLIWPVLEIKSISSFCGKALSVFLSGGKNVLYDFLKRESLNWRKLRQLTAKKIYINQGFLNEKDKAFIFDDTLKPRRGRGVEGASCHHDHVTHTKIMGHQVLEMGLATVRAYLPLDSQIYVSEKSIIHRKKAFKNHLSALARDYKDAFRKDKNTMLRDMLKRAIRKGFKATFVLADAWFGVKGNIRAVLDAKLTAIFRMKKSKLKFRLNKRDLNAKTLFHLVKFKMKKTKNLPWKTFALDVELNLNDTLEEIENWVPVRLVFVLPLNPDNKQEFALFLCTDQNLTKEKILEVYSLRWGIEVYFKEVKQNLGFLREQTGNYAVTNSSIHLSAIRYLLFLEIMLHSGADYFGEARSVVGKKLEVLTFASLLWVLFKALINGVLENFKNQLGTTLLEQIKTSLDDTVSGLLHKALQLDSKLLRAEIE